MIRWYGHVGGHLIALSNPVELADALVRLE
jgi:hypothetical protein